MTEAPVQFAWQPLTPRGVAAFARASLGRLLLVQLVMALLAAGAVAWFLGTAWFPIISQAIDHLPAQGEIRSGRLDWRGTSPQVLAAGRFLALAVDLKHQGDARTPAHLQVEFGRTDVQFFALFGFTQTLYPPVGSLAFNRPELAPWWGAWAPVLLALVAGAMVAGLMLTWTLLATLYFVPVWLIGLFADRDLNLRASWRLAGAALMPAALLLIGAIVLYGLGTLDLVGLTVAAAAHWAVGWIYLLLGSWWTPRQNSPLKGNPFKPKNQS